MGSLGRLRNSVYRFRQRYHRDSMAPNSSKPVNFAMLTHPGRVRKGNEDAVEASLASGAFVVCDGMGGAAAGEIASRLAVDAFLKALAPARDQTPRTPTPDIRLAGAIDLANQAVYTYSRKSQDLQGMGTTLVALLLQPPQVGVLGSLTLAHVGDSRCYLYRDSTLTQLTLDHSLVEEQVRLGELTPFEAERHPMRNIITRAVGSQPHVEAEIQHLDPQPGDLYLLASDGLTRELSDADIAAAFNRATLRSTTRTLNLNNLTKTLIDQANDAGGSDNITVLLLQIS